MHLELTDLSCAARTGRHCAFSSLLLWHGTLYLAYREASTHGIYPPGKIVLLRAALPVDNTMPQWTVQQTFHTGGDDRDPKLFDAGPYGIGIVWGTYYPRWPESWSAHPVLRAKETDLISHVVLSRDGQAWSTPQQMFRPNYWVWSVLYVEDDLQAPFYAAAYQAGGGGPIDLSHSIHCLQSADARLWWYDSLIVPETYGRNSLPSEPALALLDDVGTLGCVVRQEKLPLCVLVGQERKGTRKWTIQKGKTSCVHAPALINIGDTWILGGRKLVFDAPAIRNVVTPSKYGTTPEKVTTATMSLWEFDWDDGMSKPLLTLPSWGDCSYPGLVWDDANQVLWCAYYSQHAHMREIESQVIDMEPHPADIYVAKITVTKDKKR